MAPDNTNTIKKDNPNPNNIDRSQIHSTNQRSNHGHNPNTTSNNNTHKTRSYQGDKQNSNNNQRRYSNYGGNRHHNNNRNRHNMDTNIQSNTTSISSPNSIHIATSSSNSHGKSGHYHGRNRYDQNNQYSNHTRNYDTKNTQQTFVANQPPLDQNLINNMDEFPSLNDSNVVITKVTTSDNHQYSSVSNSSIPSVGQKSSTTNPNPSFYLETSASSPSINSGNNPSYSNSTNNHNNNTHQPQTQHQNTGNSSHRQYHGNRRGGGGGGGYHKNSGSREHQNNYNNKGNFHRSSNASQHNQPNVNSSSVLAVANSTSTGNHQHGINTNMRSRGNRRGANNPQNYDNSRRNSTRDYNQLPNVMNGMRIGINTNPIGHVPFSYFNPTRSYQPIIGTLPSNVTTHQNTQLPTESHTTVNQIITANKTIIYLPGDSPQDVSEAERYKALTSSTSTLSREEQIKNQIEFYFSNNNLKNDSYLRSQMDNDGWVDTIIIIRFHRISKFHLTYETLIPIIESSMKLEHKIEDGILKIRRTNEPEKWTSVGLEHQKLDLIRQYPELENLPEMNLALQNSTTTTTPQNVQPIQYGVSFGRYPHIASHPTYVGAYGGHQLAINYGIYQYDDINNAMGLMYDANGQPTYELTTAYHDPNMMVSTQNETDKSNMPSTIDYSTMTPKFNQQPYIDPSYHYTNTAHSENGYASSSNMYQYAPVPGVSTNQSEPVKYDKSIQGVNPIEPNPLESDYQLSDVEYNDLLKQFSTEREPKESHHTNKTTSNIGLKLYRYWTQNLVLNFEQTKYSLFKKYAIEDSKNNLNDGIALLYQFYERFLHRYPLINSDKSYSSTKLSSENEPLSVNQLSSVIFNDFQQVSYDDYTQGESVYGLKKLLRFKSQFSNPSRQPPPFKQHIQKLITSLGLDDGHNTQLSNNKSISSSAPNEKGSNAITTVFNTGNVTDNDLVSSATSNNIPKQGNISTHH